MPLALYVLSGELEGETFSLPENETITIGRDTANDLCINDRKLSRIHCQFEVIDDRCQVADLSSTNGTLVNGKSIDAETWLDIDDEMELGTTTLRLIQISHAEAMLTDAEREESSSAEAVVVTNTGVQCVECERPIAIEDVAAGKVRNVSERFYCPNCVASFLSETIDEPLLGEPAEAAPPSELLEEGTEIAGVRVLAALAESPLSQVYRGEQINMNRPVIIKIIQVSDKDWAQSYLDAVYASAQLIHHNIALISDTGEENKQYYVVREYVDGMSALEMLADGDPVPLDEAYNIITQTAYALEYSVRRHLFHGGLSASKILVDAEKTVKVIDFGLPQMPPRGINAEHYRQDYRPYAPPERIGKHTTSDFASDSYSLIAIFYHFLTGRTPFVGSTPEQLAERIATRQPKPLSDFVEGLPDVAQKIVARGLDKDPDSRYQHPHELLYDLEEQLRPQI